MADSTPLPFDESTEAQVLKSLQRMFPVSASSPKPRDRVPDGLRHL
jgi:hypothetical protein